MASVAHVDEWADECATVNEIEQALIELRLQRGFEGKRNLRTTMLTHMAWVPPEWQRAATETLAGLAERHPSRTVLLFPEPDAEDGLAARVLLECYEVPGGLRHLCNEVVELRLRGRRALAPASIALPLVLPDLPIFLRWRGRPDFGSPVFDQLVEMVDRLVVDSSEWPGIPHVYAELEPLFERLAVSDIAWRRTLLWRASLARAWPQLPDRIEGPPAEASLVAGWLRSRADVAVELQESDTLPFAEALDASELLSEQLDVFGRDPVYEAAAAAAARFSSRGATLN
jgi:glucose-6-phosphate dehydrogenase-like protein OpcA